MQQQGRATSCGNTTHKHQKRNGPIRILLEECERHEWISQQPHDRANEPGQAVDGAEMGEAKCFGEICVVEGEEHHPEERLKDECNHLRRVALGRSEPSPFRPPSISTCLYQG